MNRLATIATTMSALGLVACQEVPVDQQDKAANESGSSVTPASEKAAVDAGMASPQPDADKKPANQPPVPPARAGMVWKYDAERRAAIYRPPDSEAIFWVACHGSPDGRTLYVMKPGREAPAGKAMLEVVAGSLKATMPVTSVEAMGDGLSWSGEVALDTPMATLLRLAPPDRALRVTINGKDAETIPNHDAIRRAVETCYR